MAHLKLGDETNLQSNAIEAFNIERLKPYSLEDTPPIFLWSHLCHLLVSYVTLGSELTLLSHFRQLELKISSLAFF